MSHSDENKLSRFFKRLAGRSSRSKDYRRASDPFDFVQRENGDPADYPLFSTKTQATDRGSLTQSSEASPSGQHELAALFQSGDKPASKTEDAPTPAIKMQDYDPMVPETSDTTPAYEVAGNPKMPETSSASNGHSVKTDGISTSEKPVNKASESDSASITEEKGGDKQVAPNDPETEKTGATAKAGIKTPGESDTAKAGEGQTAPEQKEAEETPPQKDSGASASSSAGTQAGSSKSKVDEDKAAVDANEKSQVDQKPRADEDKESPSDKEKKPEADKKPEAKTQPKVKATKAKITKKPRKVRHIKKSDLESATDPELKAIAQIVADNPGTKQVLRRKKKKLATEEPTIAPNAQDSSLAEAQQNGGSFDLETGEAVQTTVDIAPTQRVRTTPSDEELPFIGHRTTPSPDEQIGTPKRLTPSLDDLASGQGQTVPSAQEKSGRTTPTPAELGLNKERTTPTPGELGGQKDRTTPSPEELAKKQRRTTPSASDLTSGKRKRTTPKPGSLGSSSLGRTTDLSSAEPKAPTSQKATAVKNVASTQSKNRPAARAADATTRVERSEQSAAIAHKTPAAKPSKAEQPVAPKSAAKKGEVSKAPEKTSAKDKTKPTQPQKAESTKTGKTKLDPAAKKTTSAKKKPTAQGKAAAQDPVTPSELVAPTPEAEPEYSDIPIVAYFQRRKYQKSLAEKETADTTRPALDGDENQPRQEYSTSPIVAFFQKWSDRRRLKKASESKATEGTSVAADDETPAAKAGEGDAGLKPPTEKASGKPERKQAPAKSDKPEAKERGRHESIQTKELGEDTLASAMQQSESALAEGSLGIKEFKVKGSLVVSISLLYLTLTVVNLIAFWIATGSNQMRLISANALLKAQTASFEVMRRADPLTTDASKKVWQNTPEKNIPILQKHFAEMKKDGLSIGEWLLARSDNRIFYHSGKTKPQRLESGEFQKLVRSIQLRELKGQPYYGVPDILSYNVAVYMPLTQFGSGEYVLSFNLPMESIETELASLFQLAIVMLVVMLGVQTIFGIFIFVRFIRPVRSLAGGAQSIAAGDLETRLENKRTDELGFLTHWFNQMSEALGRMTSSLKTSISELAARKEELESHMTMAAEIQAEIIPRKPGGNFINAAVHFEPLEAVSGDFYDFVRLADGSQGVLIADAMGHGVPAAFMTMMAKVHFKDAISNAYDPAHVLDLLSQNFQRINISGESYLTGIFIRIDNELNMRLARAAHQPALILRKGSTEVEHIKPAGFFIGQDSEGIQYEVYESQMQAGDRILLFTDGLVEAENREKVQYGLPAVIDLYGSTGDLPVDEQLKILIDAIHGHLDGLLNADDLTVMIVEIGENEADSVQEMARQEFRHGNYEQALAHFQEWYGAKRRKPNEVRMGIALSLMRLKKYDEALEMITELEDKEYIDYELYLNKGLALMKTGKFEECLEAYAVAGKLNPNLGLPDRSRAAVLFKLKRFDEAWQMLYDLKNRMSNSSEEYFRTTAFIKKMKAKYPGTDKQGR